MTTLWIGTSWKMNKTLAEAREWAAGLREHLDSGTKESACPHASATSTLAGIQPFVIPSFTATTTVREVLGEESPVLLGVQNAHWEDAGAWTGEVSVPQAKDAGAQIVEIGHSERREHFGETVETTRLKVAAALRHGLTPLLCIGESAEVKDAGGSSSFILEQAQGALDGLTAEELSRVVIAYERSWSSPSPPSGRSTRERSPRCSTGDRSISTTPRTCWASTMSPVCSSAAPPGSCRATSSC